MRSFHSYKGRALLTLLLIAGMMAVSSHYHEHQASDVSGVCFLCVAHGSYTGSLGLPLVDTSPISCGDLLPIPVASFRTQGCVIATTSRAPPAC